MVATRRIVEPTDPYPPSGDFRIVGYRYVDHLSLVRYNARPSGSETASDWQLAEHYAVEIDIDYRGEDGQRVEECWRIKAPRGLYTDLSSVPAFGRWIVSKVGPHLEASIIHDYLYMKWTDDRLDNRRFSDWVFADECLRAGMKDLGEFSWFQRFVVNFAVGTVGWFVFKNKTDRFSAKLALWTPHLDYLPHTPVPPQDQAPPKGLSWWTQGYFTLTVIVFALTILMGIDRLLEWFELPQARADYAWLFGGAETLLIWSTGFVGLLVIAGVIVYCAIRTLIGARRNLD